MRIRSIIGILIVLCSVSSCKTWKTDVQREFVVCDTLNRPVQGTHAYVLREFTGDDLGLFILDVFNVYFPKVEDDRHTAYDFHPQSSNSEGKVGVHMKLYYPKDHKVLFMAEGYYPTMVSLTGKMSKVILLDLENFRPREIDPLTICLSRQKGGSPQKIPAMYSAGLFGRYREGEGTDPDKDKKLFVEAFSILKSYPRYATPGNWSSPADRVPIFRQDELSKRKLNKLIGN